MADKKISALTSASTPLAGTEVLPIVQSSATVKVSVDNLTKGRTVNASTFDTDVAAAGVTLSGTTLSADGTDANINVNLTPKGTGFVQTTASDAIVRYRVNTQNAGVSANNYSQMELADNGSLRAYWRNLRDGSGAIQFAYNSALVFLTDAGGTPTEVARLTSGNYTPSTAAKGINFTANTPAAGMTSQLLNWYEEGTWTPNQGAGLTLVGAFSSSGTYTRIGRQVFIQGSVSGATSIAAASAGNISTNLPYSAGADATGTAIDAANNASSILRVSSATLTAATAIATTATITFSAVYSV